VTKAHMHTIKVQETLQFKCENYERSSEKAPISKQTFRPMPIRSILSNTIRSYELRSCKVWSLLELNLMIYQLSNCCTYR